jgi:hypothetical protein
VDKGNDIKRKSDLNKYKTAFEDYYNDTDCYPPEALWNGCECGGNCLSPHLETFFCDPTTKQRYYYAPFPDEDGVSDPCKGYRLFTKLQNAADPDIYLVGCSPTNGCGVGILASYNYGITFPGPLTASDFVPETPPITPTATPTPIPGNSFCLGGQESINPEDRICNVKTGCAPAYGPPEYENKPPCNIVLVQEFGCQSFLNSSDCETLCKSDYANTKCDATQTIDCRAYRSPQCQ